MATRTQTCLDGVCARGVEDDTVLTVEVDRHHPIVSPLHLNNNGGGATKELQAIILGIEKNQ